MNPKMNDPTKNTQKKVLQILTAYLLYSPLKMKEGITEKELKKELKELFTEITDLSKKRQNELFNNAIIQLITMKFLIRDSIIKGLLILNIEGILSAYYKEFLIDKPELQEKIKNYWLLESNISFDNFLKYENDIFNTNSTNELMLIILLDRIIKNSSLNHKIDKLNKDSNDLSYIRNFFNSLNDSENSDISLVINLIYNKYSNNMQKIIPKTNFSDLFFRTFDSIKNNPKIIGPK